MKSENMFLVRNLSWSALNPTSAYQARKAMAAYRKANPKCALTGTTKNVEVHHIIPVWKRPDLAADADNMISLSASAHIHLIFGHGGNFGSSYVANIREVIERMREAWAGAKIIRRGNDPFF